MKDSNTTTGSFIRNAFGKIFKQTKPWSDIEYFDASWKKRISEMAAFIEPGQIVMDLGCGRMWLREYLDKTNTYIPVDYIKRNDETIVCDFNRHEFPHGKADVIFISGCLEYLKTYKWFIKKICQQTKKVILSYCILEDFPDIKERRNYSWVNHLSEQTLIKLFSKYGFRLTKSLYTSSKNRIFIFEKK